MDTGTTIAGKYEVVRLIGRGGFGAVHEAIQHPIGRRVALKTIAPEHARDDEIRGRFLAEASAVAALSHPAIVTLFDFGVEPDGQIYMVLEYIDGLELDRVIRRDGPMEPARVVELGRQALAGLAEAHRRQLVHRDLKPCNLMITVDALGNEALKILDFGIAKLLGQDRGPVNTRSGYALGTPAYMSPEQAIGRGVGSASDQYALAVVLYEMLAGRPPFEGDSAFELLTKHVQARVPPLPASLDVPAGIEAVLARALSKRADERFPDVGSMSDALLAGLTEAPTSVWGSPTGPITVHRRGTRKLTVAAIDDVAPSLPPTAALRLEDEAGGLDAILHPRLGEDTLRHERARAKGTPPMIGALPTGRHPGEERPPDRTLVRWWPGVLLALVASAVLAIYLPSSTRPARGPAEGQRADEPADVPERIELTAGPATNAPARVEAAVDAAATPGEGEDDTSLAAPDASRDAAPAPDAASGRRPKVPGPPAEPLSAGKPERATPAARPPPPPRGRQRRRVEPTDRTPTEASPPPAPDPEPAGPAPARPKGPELIPVFMRSEQQDDNPDE